MPDLTIEIVPACASFDYPIEFKIGDYTQMLYHGQGPDTCTCKAYKFSKGPTKSCKHLEEAYTKECGWHSVYSSEIQMKEGICPRCGGPTISVRVAV